MSVAGMPEPWESRRLWSLWEMLKFNASAFHHATNELAWMSALIQGKAESENLSILEDKELETKDAKFLTSKLEGLLDHLKVSGARLTEMSVQEAISRLATPNIAWWEFRSLIEDISRTMRRELTTITFLVLDHRKDNYFSQLEPLFGTDVSAKFPSMATYEIEEAGKCLALERSTASAFHSIGALKLAFGLSLGV